MVLDRTNSQKLSACSRRVLKGTRFMAHACNSNFCRNSWSSQARGKKQESTTKKQRTLLAFPEFFFDKCTKKAFANTTRLKCEYQRSQCNSARGPLRTSPEENFLGEPREGFVPPDPSNSSQAGLTASKANSGSILIVLLILLETSSF